MFDNVKKVLEEYEIACKYLATCSCFNDVDQDKINTYDYFNVNLAKALMQDRQIPSESVAKIILAAKNISNEIHVKIE